MAFTVEDGTGLEDANSYLSEDDLDAYLEDHGLTVADTVDKETALVRATQYIDRTFEGRWSGTKVNGRSQALAWPREDAVDASGEDIASDEVPREVKDATAEAAYRECTTAGSLTPAVSTAGAIKRQKVEGIEREFFEGADTTRPILPIIEDLLKPLLANSGGTESFLLRA